MIERPEPEEVSINFINIQVRVANKKVKHLSVSRAKRITKSRMVVTISRVDIHT